MFAALFVGAILTAMQPVSGQAADAPAPPPPLSAAQTALFDTPHLANVTRPQTLDYRFNQLGPGGFTDTVSVTVAEIHQDGTKDMRFDFLSGDRHVEFPGIAHFTGNPLLMLFLEYDVRQMRDQTGMAAAYFRGRIRQSFLDAATVSDTTATVDGQTVPAHTVVVQPYANDPRFGHIKVIQGKTYTFVLSPVVPGGIVTIRAEEPADPSVGAPVLGNDITYAAAHP